MLNMELSGVGKWHGGLDQASREEVELKLIMAGCGGKKRGVTVYHETLGEDRKS